MSQPTVYAIFPIPIYTIECDVDITDAVNFLEQSHSLIPNEFADDYGCKSEDDYILDNPVCNPLKDFIIKHLTNYASSIMAWEFESFQITQSWVSIKQPGEQHGLHYHPNSMLSAVFYFQQDSEKTEYIKFHRPEIITQLMNQFSPAISIEKQQHTEFPWHFWSMPPKKNTLVIFPSWINHSVGKNTDTVARKSLAVNAIPTGKFGNRHSSAEIDISRLK